MPPTAAVVDSVLVDTKNPNATLAHPTVTQSIGDLQGQIDSLSQQVSHLQRLATLGTMASGIAHEFNNLLTPIISYCQVALQGIESGKPDDAMIRKALDKSLARSAKAARVCQAMLNLSRGQEDYTSIPICRLVDDTLAVMAREPEKEGVRLILDVPLNLVVYGDEVQLQQVLLNLVLNAMHAMHGHGGSLTISASEIEPGRNRIDVSDTGPGISPKIMDRIFEPFFTTRATAAPGETRGTGLGLSICQQIVNQHGGKITVTSSPGKGARFSVELRDTESCIAAAGG